VARSRGASADPYRICITQAPHDRFAVEAFSFVRFREPARTATKQKRPSLSREALVARRGLAVARSRGASADPYRICITQAPHDRFAVEAFSFVRFREPARTATKQKRPSLSREALVARRGFEPRQTEPKSVVLPLYYRAIVPPKRSAKIRSRQGCSKRIYSGAPPKAH
jgi:hypothetical protein